MTNKIQYWDFSISSSKFWLARIPRILGLGLTIVLSCIISYPTIASSNTNDSSSTQQSQSNAGLHRLDFRLEGKSCAACLLSIQRKLNSLPGVKEAVVMLKRPYGVSVIYQTDQIKTDEILAIVKEKEPAIKIFEINDTAVPTMPSPLIPPFVPVTQTAQ